MAIFYETSQLFLMLFLVTGSIAGFFAGLLGIGGGIIFVPALLLILPNIKALEPSYTAHYAIATALSVIIPTGLSSAFAHIKNESFNRPLFLKLTPGIIIGALLGPVLAMKLDTDTLSIIFSIVIFALAVITRFKPEKPHSVISQKLDLPVGLGIGMISSLTGIGGATLNVPYMTLRSVDLHKAIGTASALGIVIACSASLSFIYNGPPNVSNHYDAHITFGFVVWPATILIAISSIITARLGANIAHTLSKSTMSNIFSAFMIGVAIYVITKIILY